MLTFGEYVSLDEAAQATQYKLIQMAKKAVEAYIKEHGLGLNDGWNDAHVHFVSIQQMVKSVSVVISSIEKTDA